MKIIWRGVRRNQLIKTADLCRWQRVDVLTEPVC